MYSIKNLQDLFIGQRSKKFTIEEIKKIFKINSEEKIDELMNDIKALEEEGVILEMSGKYTCFPKNNNYILKEVKIDKNHMGYFYLNNERYQIFIDDLNGALHNDLCVLTIDKKQKMARVKKIIKRRKDLIICEIKNSKPVMYGMDCMYTLEVTDSHLKKLKDGTRILIRLKNELKNNNLQADLVEVLGHVDEKDIDLKCIALSKHFNIEFNKDVIKELANIKTEVSEEELNDRCDFRDKLIYTIDCDRTKDMDDAVSIEINDQGNYVIGIHIADVSHYVKYGSAIFNEAYDRATSLYMVDSVIPMLPAILSNGICSLNPNVDRLTKSCIMEFDKFGNLLDYKIVKSVINSKMKMKYSEVNRILEDNEIIEEYEQFIDNLKLFNQFNKILDKNKFRRGYIEFYSDEINIEVDENGFPLDFNLNKQGTAEKLIENLMILANETVASHYAYLPFIYRIHDLPDDEKLKKILDFLRTIGIKIQYIKDFSDPKTVQLLLRQLSKLEIFPIISRHILQGMKKASYSNDNIGHFGLALEYYTHFTSPIRRLPDLLVHALIDEYEKCDEPDKEQIKKIEDYLQEACRHASFKERMAQEAEREADTMKMAEYMEKQIGNYFNGKIIDICSSGITIQTKNHITGHAMFSDIKNDFYRFDKDRFIMVGKRSKDTYQIGDKVRIKVKSASKELRTIDFEIKEKLTCDKVKVLK